MFETKKIDIEVMSREKASTFSFVVDKPCIFISINDIGSSSPLFAVNDSIKDVLTLFFDDEEDTLKGMNPAHAKRVVDFVCKWKEKIDLIVVHCGAGISRSAGVAAAIGKVINGDDNFIFKNPKFVPNRNCYRQTLNAFIERFE